MSLEKNVQIVTDFLAALGSRDEQSLLALADEEIEWIKKVDSAAFHSCLFTNHR